MINVLQNFHWKTRNNLIPLIWKDLIYLCFWVFLSVERNLCISYWNSSLKNLYWNLVQFIGHCWAAAVFYTLNFPFVCIHLFAITSVFDHSCQILSSLIMMHLKYAKLETPNLIICICWTLSTCDFHVTFCTNFTSFRFISIFQELVFSDVWMYVQEMEVSVGQEDLKGSKRTV